MIYKIAIVAAVLFMIFIMLLVRNKKLHEKYSILWVTFSVLIIIVSIAYNLIDSISYSLGIYYSPALLFLGGFAFLIMYIIHLSIVVTKQSRDIIKLNQELAILNEKVEKNLNKGGEEKWNM